MPPEDIPATSPSAARAPATLDFALLRGALEELPFGVATTRGQEVLYANEALTRIFGAAPGAIEQKPLSALFPAEVFAEIKKALDEARVFDGRVRARTFDGRDIDVEAHLQWYASEAQGAGGFLVVREVSLELGALARMVDGLGGAIFRVRVADGVIESVSPAIARLTGLDAQKCIQRPVLLTTLLSSEERERVAFLYRRVAKGELITASAQVSLRRADGTVHLVQLRATARRDTSGVVRHIDGVVHDAARDPEVHAGLGDPRAEPAPAGRDAAARPTMDLTYEMLREASQHLTSLFREVRAVRAALKAHADALPPDVSVELGARLDAITAAAGATGALNRGVRHALARATLGATIAEVLEGVRATLAPAIGDHAVSVDAGDASTMVLQEHAEEITLVLTHLALRAFRFAGSGSLRVTARKAPARAAIDAPGFGGRGRWSDPRGLRRTEREYVVLEVVGSAPPDLADAAQDISSEMLRAVARPEEADVAYAAAQALVTIAGGAIESDDATFSTARTVIRLRG